VLVGEVEDEEDVDEEVKLVVAVVGKTGLTELCTVPADVYRPVSAVAYRGLIG
jgi:hypothetical protein